MVTFEAGEGDQIHDHNPMIFHVIEGGKQKLPCQMDLLMRERFLLVLLATILKGNAIK